jgi:hypothetical protein
MLIIRQKTGQKCFIPPLDANTLIACVKYAGYNPSAAAQKAQGAAQIKLLAHEQIHLAIFKCDDNGGTSFRCITPKPPHNAITLLQFRDAHQIYYIWAPHGQYQAHEFLCYAVTTILPTPITALWTVSTVESSLVVRRLPLF